MVLIDPVTYEAVSVNDTFYNTDTGILTIYPEELSEYKTKYFVSVSNMSFSGVLKEDNKDEYNSVFVKTLYADDSDKTYVKIANSQFNDINVTLNLLDENSNILETVEKNIFAESELVFMVNTKLDSIKSYSFKKN